MMVHGYHVIWGTYGFWLPNDPRGSWSDYVYSWELARYGQATRSHERNKIADDLARYAQWRDKASQSLKYPAVTLSGIQAYEVAKAFEQFTLEKGLTIWAFSILEQHLHLVLGRFRYGMEIVANHLKGYATRRLTEIGMNPMKSCGKKNGKVPSMWGEGQWIAYLESDGAIENAIHYVEANPIREGKRPQQWSFVSPFDGIPKGGWLTYH